MSTALSTPVSAILEISGMNCASCVAHVEKAARSVPGVQACQVNLATGRAAVRFDPETVDIPAVARAISDSGYPAQPQSENVSNVEAEERRIAGQSREARGWAWRAAVGAVLWLPIEAAHWMRQLGSHAHHAMPAQGMAMGWVELLAATAAMVLVGSRFYASAFAALRHRTSNMDTLISMGASVAYGYSLVYFMGGLLGVWPPPAAQDLFFMEGTGLLALISLGHWLEARARQSAGRAIRELLELAPSVALRLMEPMTAKRSSLLPILGSPAAGKAEVEYEQIPAAGLEIGDRILVRPGDRVAADGVVTEGQSSVDESMITGEAIPVLRKPGDAVIGGTLNSDGRLTVRVTKTGSDTALAQIVKLVENAQSTKPPVQQLADRVSAVFVPSVLLIAVITGVCWYAGGRHAGWPAAQLWSAIARAVCSVLIIACPCALGLAVPATVMVGTGLGARRGILIRDIDAIQSAQHITTVVLDKTGTVTMGRPKVLEAIPASGIREDELLRLAAAAEQFSAHPLAKAIVQSAKDRRLSIPEPTRFSSEAGFGIVAEIEGRQILVGSAELLAKYGGSSDASNGDASSVSAATEVHVAGRGAGGGVERLGVIRIADEVKPDSRQAIDSLHRMGLRTVLLTGDHQAAADAVAKQVRIERVRAGVKPGEKAAFVRSLQEGGKVAMVGDGINDAPALAAADLGIALGGGSDIAKETGGIVLVSGSLSGVAAAIRLSRATMRKIHQNLFLAFIYNILAIPIAAGVLYPAFGILLSPLIAAAAMALSDVTVIGNALLLRRARIE